LRLVLVFIILLTLKAQAFASAFEAECRTKIALREPIVTKVKLVQSGPLWLGETVIPGVQAERLFVHLHDTNGEVTFDTAIKRNEKIVGVSGTEILWRDEDAQTGHPVVDNPEAAAHIVFNDDLSGVKTVVVCSIHQN
jgi:hypothetical protein